MPLTTTSANKYTIDHALAALDLIMIGAIRTIQERSTNDADTNATIDHFVACMQERLETYETDESAAA